MNTRSAGLLGIESKCYDAALTDATAISTAWASTNNYMLSAVLFSQGTGVNQRDGLKAMITSVHFYGQIFCTGGDPGTDTDEYVDLAIVCDTQPNGAQPLAGAVFLDTIDAGACAIGAPPLVENQSRFKVLKRKIVRVDNLTSGIAGCRAMKHFSLVVKCRMPVQYSGSSATISNVVSNNIFLYAGKSGLFNGATSMYGSVRTRFYG